ncbi:hypothetical protein Hanom_Chr12g01175091 [Helianthus anomalus]
MHHAVVLIAKRQKGFDAKLLSSRGVSLETTSLFLHDRGKVVYILPFSGLTLTLLLIEFIEYDDDDFFEFNKRARPNYKKVVLML